MKTLIIFYSLEGNSKKIAMLLKEKLGADILELKTVKEFPNKGFKKYVWGGKSVVLKEKPTLQEFAIDLSQYDNIILGTPVWAGKYAAPFNTFFSKVRITGKNIEVFACHGGGGAEKCFEQFKQSIPDNRFLSFCDFVDPTIKNQKENEEKALQWISKTLDNLK